MRAIIVPIWTLTSLELIAFGPLKVKGPVIWLIANHPHPLLLALQQIFWHVSPLLCVEGALTPSISACLWLKLHLLFPQGPSYLGVTRRAITKPHSATAARGNAGVWTNMGMSWLAPGNRVLWAVVSKASCISPTMTWVAYGSSLCKDLCRRMSRGNSSLH